jgi:hypothetical protein
VCLQETHLHEHQWADILKQFRTATKGGDGVASHAPNAAFGQRSFTCVSILFTLAILSEGLVVRTGTLLRDTEGRWVSVQIEWTGITITLVCFYAPAATAERRAFIDHLGAQLPIEAPNLVVLGYLRPGHG